MLKPFDSGPPAAGRDGDPSVFEVAIVGGGPAGLSAAGVLARARVRTVLLDEGRPGNAVETRMRGFLTRDGIAPAEFRRLAREELSAFPSLHWAEGRVLDIREAGGNFELSRAVGPSLLARRVLCTGGLEQRLPDVPGYQEQWGKGILHCPYCQGWDRRDARLCVWGLDPHLPHLALLVRSWSQQVCWLLPPELELEPELLHGAARLQVSIVRGEVQSVIAREGRLSGLALRGGVQLACDAVFHRPEERLPPLFTRLGLEQRQRRIAVDAEHRSSRPGIYAAGDLTSHHAQAIAAAGDGQLAAIHLHQHLIAASAHLERGP